MNNIKISIITPCYNGEKFIRSAIESFINQNNQQIEMIVVNDGSKDSTREICEEYTQLSNVRLINVKNGGAGKARNIGIKAARGKIVAFLDSDDLLLLGSLDVSRVAEICSKFEQGIDIIYTPRLKTNIDLTDPVKINKAEEVQKIEHHIPKLEFWTCLYKKEYLETNDIFFYEYQIQDIETAFRYRAFSQTERILVDNDFCFYLQRDNMESNTHTWNSTKLFYVKTLVYYDLFLSTKVEDDKNYLLTISLDNLKRFYRSALKYNVPTQFFYDIREVCHKIRESCKRREISILKLDILKTLANAIKPFPKKKTRTCNRSSQYISDERVLMSRLEKISLEYV